MDKPSGSNLPPTFSLRSSGKGIWSAIGADSPNTQRFHDGRSEVERVGERATVGGSGQATGGGDPSLVGGEATTAEEEAAADWIRATEAMRPGPVTSKQ